MTTQLKWKRKKKTRLPDGYDSPVIPYTAKMGKSRFGKLAACRFTDRALPTAENMKD